MNKTYMLAATGVLVTGFVIGSVLLFNGHAHNMKTNTKVQTEETKSGEGIYQNFILEDNALSASEDIMDYIKDLDYLTEDEKMQLVNDERAAAPIYQKIELLEEEIEKRSEEVLKAHAFVLDEYDKLIGEHQELWKKMAESEAEEQETAANNREYINASPVLTAEEKQILLQQEDKIESMDAKLDAVYAEVDEATKVLSQSVDDLYREIDVIHSKSQNIWDKIQDHEVQSDKKEDGVPYF